MNDAAVGAEPAASPGVTAAAAESTAAIGRHNLGPLTIHKTCGAPRSFPAEAWKPGVFYHHASWSSMTP